MLSTRHLPEGPHPVVAQCAREMLDKSDNELAGIVSTAKTCLNLYNDPFIARNTSASDFRIDDLMNADVPVSLYLVVPPSDIDRTRPLVRLMLNQIGKRLTESLSFGDKPAYRHRLLLLLDEFPSLGRLDFFQTSARVSRRLRHQGVPHRAEPQPARDDLRPEQLHPRQLPHPHDVHRARRSHRQAHQRSHRHRHPPQDPAQLLAAPSSSGTSARASRNTGGRCSRPTRSSACPTRTPCSSSAACRRTGPAS